jgi:hypothetical protein
MFVYLLFTLAGVLSIPFAEIDEPFAAWVNMDNRFYTIINFSMGEGKGAVF